MNRDFERRDRARDARDRGEETPADRPAATSLLLRLQASAGNAAAARLVAERRGLSRLTAPANPREAEERSRRAIAQHRDQSTILLGWLAEGRRSADPVLKNACDWIAMGNSRLYAVTPTGDSDERVTHHGQDPRRQRAYFPKVDDANEEGDITRPGGGDYDWRDLDDQTHVKLQSVATRGWNTSTALPSGIAVAGVPTAEGITAFFANVTAGAIGKEEFFTAVKHEVQHAADRSQDKADRLRQQNDAALATSTAGDRLIAAVKASAPNLDPNDLALVPLQIRTVLTNLHAARLNQTPFADADVQAFKAWGAAKRGELVELHSLMRLEKYKTEFRAYSYQGTYLALDNQANYDAQVPASFRVAGRPWTERQYRVFRQIYLGYDHTNQGWEADDPVFGAGRRFRQAVLAYRDPDEEGVNKLDSPRINALYDRLLALPLNTGDANLPAVRDLDPLVLTFSPVEAAYVRNAVGATRELTTVIQARLQGAARDRLHAVLELRASA